MRPGDRLPARLLVLLFAHIAIADPSHCYEEAHETWSPKGGVSAGMTHCFQRIVETLEKQGDPYLLIDPPLEGIERVPVSTGYDGLLPTVQWNVSVSHADLRNMTPSWHHWSYQFNRAEWLLPRGYKQTPNESRVVFIHGGNAGDSSVGPYYAGMTTRIANITGLPVFAFDYAQEPITPWPQNIRQVLFYLGHALHNGPFGAGDASRIVLVADSEGTLVATQTIIALRDPTLHLLLGYSHLFPPSTEEYIGGVVLSSPVIDVTCRTPSFATNCFNFSDPRAHLPGGAGDPDTGNCSLTPTIAARRDDCLWSYLEYFFGLEGVLAGAPRPRGTATKEVDKRAAFFAQPTLSPLAYQLSGFPPLLLIAGARDFFYADGPSLHERACKHGVDVSSFNVAGAYHDFIEYSEGCGGPHPNVEALEAYVRLGEFVTRVTASKTVDT